MHESGTEDDVDPVGAYGVRISGLEASAASLVAVPEDWPHLTIRRVDGPCLLQQPFHLDDRLMQLRIADRTGGLGGIELTRSPLEVCFTSTGGFGDDEILHPDLGALAAVINHWSGRDSMHAGAFVTDAGAWAVLGEREAGKSSLIAQLAAGGHGILSDDIVVVDEEGRALAGPRCVDLRESAAAYLGMGTDIGMVGERRRWRFPVPRVPAAVPLRGWIRPQWGEHTECEMLPAAERLSTLFENRYVYGQAPPRPMQLLELAALPFVEFRRPRRWEVAEAATATLLAHLDDL